MIKIQKVPSEYKLLVEHYKTSDCRLLRDRAHCIMLAMQARTVPDIALILARKQQTIRTWLTAYDGNRLASIFPKYSSNTNAGKLTTGQLAEIKITLDSAPDTSNGLPEAFWSVKKLKSYVQAEYGVIYESERSYHHLFAVSNFSFKLPEGFDRRRDDELVASRMAEIATEIDTKQAEGYEVFFADECGLAWETEYRRAWLPKGQKTVMKVCRDKTRQNYFGAINIATGKEELIRLNWQNTDNMIEALRELITRYPHKKLAIVWDNAMWHRSKQLKAMLGQNSGGEANEFARLHFIWMPPYAPDHNPQEHIWKVAKQATKNNVTKTFEELKQIFEVAIASRIFDYKMLLI